MSSGACIYVSIAKCGVVYYRDKAFFAKKI